MRAALAAVLVLLALPAAAGAAPSLVKVGDFDQPVHVAGPPGDPARLFVVEKPGRVQVLVDGARAGTFLDVAGEVSDVGERGLLSIAFAPDYAASGLFYVFYTANDGALTVREGQRAADPQRATLGRTLFAIPHPADNHNGGQLAFGPDGALYVSVGDGGSQGDPEGDAQDPASWLGKILRVDAATGARSVWGLGLRNPWRFSFDRATGAMIIGDVGGGEREEVSVAPPSGGNFGWNVCEGLEPGCPAGSVLPALSMERADGYSGVIGGFVVRDPSVPSLLGRYLFGDLAKPTLLSAELGVESRPCAESTLPVSGPSSFGEDAAGRVHVASLGGAVWRVAESAGVGPCTRGRPGGTAPPPAGGTPTAADTDGCGLRIRRKRVRGSRRLRIALRAEERCVVTLRARRFRTRRVLLAAGARRVVRMTPTRRGLRQLRRPGRTRVTLRISARDAAGNRAVRRIGARVP